jgi:hypothetical protein
MTGGIGRMLMAMGGLIFLVGMLLWAGGRLLPGIGRLPGDIVIQRGNFTFYFPLLTSILISLFLTFILWVIRRL